MTALWVTGDTLEVARQLPDNSVDLIFTSPPFLALRSYLPADDPAKAHEIGQESTPGEFLDVLLDLVVEWRRILTPHGSLCVELGDTYSGSGGAGGDYDEGGMREGQEVFKARTRPRNDGGQYGNYPQGGTKHNLDERPITGGSGWPSAKSLCLIPQSFAWALSYGRNPHTGRTIEPWRVRNIIRWVRPNPPVGALGDKFRPATSEITVACVGASRYFDLDAVRVPHDPRQWRQKTGLADKASNQSKTAPTRNDAGQDYYNTGNPAGAPPLDWWEIPTYAYRGSH